MLLFQPHCLIIFQFLTQFATNGYEGDKDTITNPFSHDLGVSALRLTLMEVFGFILYEATLESNSKYFSKD